MPSGFLETIYKVLQKKSPLAVAGVTRGIWVLFKHIEIEPPGGKHSMCFLPTDRRTIRKAKKHHQQQGHEQVTS